MKGLTIGLGVLAVLALGAGNSAADGFVSMPPPTVNNGVYNSDGYIMVNNWDNGGGGAGTGTNFNSPYATTDGALWIVTGGVPVQVSQDVNMTLYSHGFVGCVDNDHNNLVGRSEQHQQRRRRTICARQWLH